MVKVTRINNEKVINGLEKNKSNQPTDGRQNFIHVNVAKKSSRRRKSMPSLFKDDHSKSGISQRSSRREKDFSSRNKKGRPIVTRLSIIKDKNEVLPHDGQTISSLTGNGKVFDTLDERTPTPEENIWPKWFFWCATGTIILGIGAIIAVGAVIISRSPGLPKTNWVSNGNAESGSCEAGTGFTHPIYWNYNGTITPIYYNNNNGDLLYTDPGPSDRGNCYFYGQQSVITSMWQTVTIPDSINPFLIDNQKISYNLSAWMGGSSGEDDNAQVSLTFINQTNQQVGNIVTIGPVLAAERGNVTSLIFHQSTGLIPSSTRSFMITVTITLLSGTTNDGDIDNIAVFFYE